MQNPLAQDVVDACGKLGLNVVFEPGKTHPRDWANPGRARVELKEGGRGRGRGVENSEFLLASSVLAVVSCRGRW